MNDTELIEAYRSKGPRLPAGVPMPREVIAGLRAVYKIGVADGKEAEWTEAHAE